MNPQGKEWNLLYLPKHEDRIAGKGFTSMIRYNFVHKFLPVPQAMKIPDAKAAVEKLEKARGNSSMSTGKVKSKKEVILEAQRDRKQVHFATPMDICHLKNAE